jgi:hypothetical protein
MTPKRESDMVIQNRDKKALLRLQFEQQFMAVIFLSIYLPSPVDSITMLNSGDVQEVVDLKLLYLYIIMCVVVCVLSKKRLGETTGRVVVSC